MKDEEIDDVLKKAEGFPHQLKTETLQRIADSLRPSLRPVRPLPPAWAMTGGLLLICTVVALAAAARAGFFGIGRMSLLERALIFPVLFVLAWVSSVASVHEIVPGSRKRISSGALLVVVNLVLIGTFALLFHDYQTTHFFSAGIACLLTGLLYALPAAVLAWVVLRRGFAVNPAFAGMAAGTLAGLAGLGMLELHCPNFQLAHVLVWHIAVVLLSGAAGALMGLTRRLWASESN